MSQRFQIEDLIHQDGMGVIFRALDRETDQMVVLHRFFPYGVEGGGLQEDEQAAFYRTLEQLSRLSHPTLQTVIAGGCDPVDGAPFVVMPWLDGDLPDSSMDESEWAEKPLVEVIMYALEGRNALVALMQTHLEPAPEMIQTILRPIARPQMKPPKTPVSPVSPVPPVPSASVARKPKLGRRPKASKIWMLSVTILAVLCIFSGVLGTWYFLGLRIPIGFLGRSPTASMEASLGLTSASSESLPPPPEVFDWKDRETLLTKAQETVTIRGRVQKVEKGPKNSVQLHFSENGDSTATRGVVMEKNINNDLSRNFLKLLQGKNVRITGTVKVSKPLKNGRRPQIEIQDRESVVLE